MSQDKHAQRVSSNKPSERRREAKHSARLIPSVDVSSFIW